MNGEKRNVDIGNSSADGNALSNGFNPLEILRQVQYFIVDDDEELAAPNPKETDGSEDTIEAFIEDVQGLQRDRLKMKRWMEKMLEKTDLYEAYSHSLAARVKELASLKETDRSKNTIKVLEGEIQGFRRNRSELRRLEEMLEKKERSEAYNLSLCSLSLAAHVTELEGDLAHSQENLNLISSKADSLRFTVKTLESDKSILEDRLRDLEAGISDLELKNSKVVSDALEKEAIINSMKEELNIERDKAMDAVKKKDEEFFKMEELENLKKEVEMEREKYYALAKEKVEIISLKELDVVTLNEVEIKSLKEELKTAREKVMDEIDTLKDNTRVEAAQKEEVGLFLEEKLRLSRDNRREQHEMVKKKAVACSKISWITTAVVAASSSTVAAAVTALCMHRNKQS